VAKAGRSRARRLALGIPPGPSGAYVVSVQAGRDRARAVVPVEGERARRILVVLPQLTWQGRNDTDDNGDGLPDALARDRPARIRRPYARGRLPRGFRASEGPLLAFLHRNRLGYELTTDLALTGSGDSPFAAYEGVVLAGDAVWLPRVLGLQLKAFVLNGGRLLSLGTGSLRRTARIRAGRLTAPSRPAPVDLLRARLGPAQAEPLELLVQSDRLRLFAGTAGSLGAFDRWEPTLSLAEGRLAAVAGATGGEPVFVAYRLARGLVIRPGVRGWGAALEEDVGPNAETMRRIWTLLG
jgi:hypothetical protein